MRRKGLLVIGLIAALYLAACSSGQAGACQPTQFGREYPYGSPAFSFTNVWFHSDDQTLWAGLDAQEQESNARFPYKNNSDLEIVWWRSDVPKFEGALTVEARRLDAEADPIRADGVAIKPDQMRTTLNLPSAGCWEVKGSNGDKNVTFVMELTQ